MAKVKTKPKRGNYRTCSIDDVDEDLEQWGASEAPANKRARSKRGSRRMRSNHQPANATVSTKLASGANVLQPWNSIILAYTIFSSLLLVGMLWPGRSAELISMLLAASSPDEARPSFVPPPAPPPPSVPSPVPPPSIPMPTTSCSPRKPPLCPPPPVEPYPRPPQLPPDLPPPLRPPPPPTPPPPPSSPPRSPPSPHPPGYTVCSGLNAQFKASTVSKELERAGILVHVFDGISDSQRPWLPCAEGDCAVYGDRFATSLLYPGWQDVYQGGQGGWQKGGGFGFVLNTEGLAMHCAYYADGGSQGKVCEDEDIREDREKCLPGCGDWCDPDRGAFNFGGCSWQPKHLRYMILQQKQIHPGGGYNEIIIDSQSWVDYLPHTIRAMFVCVNEDGYVDDPEKLEHAREVHSRFTSEYGLSPLDVPLLAYDGTDRAEPFRITVPTSSTS